jgi:hypothetical protein
MQHQSKGPQTVCTGLEAYRQGALARNTKAAYRGESLAPQRASRLVIIGNPAATVGA